MAGFRNVMMGAAGVSTGGYQVDNSAVFNDDDSEYLTRTPSNSATSTRKFTMAAWVKRGNLGTNFPIFSARSGANSDDALNFTTGDKLEVMVDYTNDGQLTTNAVFRDPHAWYHIVLAVDTEQDTASNRLKLYVNNELIESFSTANYPAENYDFERWQVSGNENTIGRTLSVAAGKADGYMAEVVWVDGQQLTPSSFGETDSNGVWRPIYPTTISDFGNHGYYLNFASSGSDLGDDASGNSNDFTNTNSVTQTSDSPTKNYAVLSPLSHQTNGDLSKGNTTTTTGSADQGLSFSSFPVTTGQKVYIEATCSGATSCMTGCVKAISAVPQDPSSDFDALESADGGAGRLLHIGTGDVSNSDGNTSASNYAPNGSVPVTHMIALDLVNDKIYWGDAGVGASGWSDGSGSFNQSFDNAVGVDLTANLDWFFAFRPFTGTIEVNFGATAFTVSPPTGYSSGYSAAIEKENRETALTIEDGSAYFQATTYSGTGSAREVNQSGNSQFTPDFVWVKKRNGANEHRLIDAVRGATKTLFSDGTAAESTESTGVTSFDSDGFSVGPGGGYNNSSGTYVGWQWLAGNSTASNSDGSITSTVSVNQTANFSVVSWTGSGANATIGHGLGAAPSWILIKNLADADSWVVYHDSMGATKGAALDTTAVPATASTFFNDTAPTSTVFSVGSGGRSNGSSDAMIAYCWAEKPGFSKFGSYEGNVNNNGIFIELGFKPTFLTVKNIDATGAWLMFDSAREPFNVMDLQLHADDNAAEANDTSRDLDFLANGIKLRGNSSYLNSAHTFIYMAFAEHPFAGTTPATAR
jgi:hypothetical protein